MSAPKHPPYIVTRATLKRYDVLRLSVGGRNALYLPYLTAPTQDAAETVARLLTEESAK